MQRVVWCVRDRDAPGLDTVVPLETTAAYNMMDVITGVCTGSSSISSGGGWWVVVVVVVVVVVIYGVS